MRKRQKCAVSLVLSAALILGGMPMQGQLASAKAKLKLNKTSAKIKVGSKLKLKVKGTKKKVKWSSNKKKIATVSSKGVVKAKKKGTARITAKIGRKKLICKVKVLAAAKKTAQATKKPNATAKTTPTASQKTTETPNVTAAPSTTATPEPTATSGATTKPNVTTTPGATTKPNVTTTPGATTAPTTSPAPTTPGATVTPTTSLAPTTPGATVTPTTSPAPTTPSATAAPTASPAPSTTPGQNVSLPEDATVFTMGTKQFALGMTGTDVKTVLGTASGTEVRTGQSPQGFTTIAYNTKTYSEYLLFYLKDDIVVSICGIGSTMSYGGAAAKANGNNLSNTWQNSSDYKTSTSVTAARKASLTGNETAYAFYDALGDNTIYCIQAYDKSKLTDENDLLYGNTGNLTYGSTINQSIATEIGNMLNAYRAVYSIGTFDLTVQGLKNCAQAYCDTATGSKITGRSGDALFDVLYDDYGIDPLNWGEAAYYGAADAVSFANSMIEEAAIRPVLVNQSANYNYAGIGMSAKTSGSGYNTYVIMDYCDEVE